MRHFLISRQTKEKELKHNLSITKVLSLSTHGKISPVSTFNCDFCVEFSSDKNSYFL